MTGIEDSDKCRTISQEKPEVRGEMFDSPWTASLIRSILYSLVGPGEYYSRYLQVGGKF